MLILLLNFNIIDKKIISLIAFNFDKFLKMYINFSTLITILTILIFLLRALNKKSIIAN